MKKKKSQKKVVVKAKKSVSKQKQSGKKIVTTLNKSQNKSGIIPLGDKVLVKPIAAETTTSFGIIIPDSAKEKPETGMVVAVGPGRKADNGTVVPVGVQVGDKIMFSKYGFDEIKVAGVEYYLISETNILAILNS
jgi:chaperonin GroES